MNVNAISFVENRISSLSEEIKHLEAKKVGVFYSEWFRWNMEQIVKAETSLELWSPILEQLKKEDVEPEETIRFLKARRQYFLRDLIQSRRYSSTNPISNEIETFKQDAIKEFIGMDIMDSLAYVLDRFFNVSVELT